MRLVVMLVVAITVSLLVGFLEPTLSGGGRATVVRASPLTRRVAQATRFLEQVRRVDVEELRKGMERGTAIAVDVRSERAYRADHVVGAIWLYHRETIQHLDRLPRNKTLVLYCT